MRKVNSQRGTEQFITVLVIKAEGLTSSLQLIDNHMTETHAKTMLNDPHGYYITKC
jgi:hypothetical protein